MPPVEPVEVPKTVEIRPELVGAYFPKRLPGRIVDPQGLITQSRKDGLRHFFEFHSQEAQSDLFFLVLGKDQIMPGGQSLLDHHQRWFGDELVALVVYHVGDPQMTQVV
ncbi:MAG: hypothetical protein AAF492_26955, partial [Verrucomicrobiota bacterium]